MTVAPVAEPHVVQVYLGPRTYDILVVTQRLDDAASLFEPWIERLTDGRSQTGRALVVSDRNVGPLHASRITKSLNSAGWDCHSMELEPGETSKSLDSISRIYDELVNLKADRQTVVVAVGGGVIGDAAGFAAATYARGIPFIQIPTSLLAHVDSSVGGKVGINHPRAKNLIGAFHQPLGVLIDTATIDSLPEREFRSGLAEVVKYGVILDDAFFAWLESNAGALNDRSPEALRTVIARSCRLKADVVEQDEFERTGLRAVLNYGHTFAHAYEALAGYGELLHGEAVSIGMVHAAELSVDLGRIDRAAADRQNTLLKSLHLPLALPQSLSLSIDEVISTMKLDKKAKGGQMRFVLPTKIGSVELVNSVPEAAVRNMLSRLFASNG